MNNWQLKKFVQLSNRELYDILKLRQDVFVIEQNCIYSDLDDADKDALHLFCYNESGEHLNAYLRMFAPGPSSHEVTMGRILTSERCRGSGLGKRLVEYAIQLAEERYSSAPIKISAQLYLVEFYRHFNFVVISEAYDEDGIQHIDMLRGSE